VIETLPTAPKLPVGPIPASSNLRIVLVWLALLLVAGSILISRLEVDDDLAVFLPTEGSPVEDLLFARLKEGPASRLILVAFAGGDLAARVAASNQAAEALQGRDDLARVGNGGQAMAPADLAELFRYRYLVADTDLDQAALDQAVATRAKQLGSPFGRMYRLDAANDPTGVFQNLLVAWRDGARPPPQEDGVWVTEDRSRSLLLLETRANAFDLRSQAVTVEALEQTLGEITAGAGLELQMAGSPVTMVRTQALIQREMTVGTIAALVLIGGFLFWIFRSKRVLILSLVPILAGVLVGVTAVLLGFGSIHRITLAFGVTLLGVAIDYPLHLFSHTRAGEPLGGTAKRIEAPMLLGAGTTVAAFLILGTGGFAGLAQLAVFTAGGLVAAALTARYVVPALGGEALALEASATPFGRGWILPAWPRFILLAAGAGAIGVLLVKGDSIWERDITALSPVPSSFKHLDGDLRAALGAPDLRYLYMVSGENAETLLQASEALGPVLAGLEDDGVIGSYDAVHRYLPSIRTQEERQAALPSTAALEARLQEAIPPESELEPATFEPFVEAVDVSRTLAPLTPERARELLQDTPLANKLDSLMSVRDGRWYGFVPLSAVQDLATLDAAAAGLAGVEFIDLRTMSSGQVTDFRDQALLRLAFGVAVILALLLLARRDLETALRILLAMAVALLIAAAVLVLAGELFSLFHILASLVVIGVGLDYGLFFSWKGDRPEERRRATYGIAVCAVSTVIVFALLAFSSIALLRVIGLTVALGTLLTFLSCYLLVALPTWRSADDAPPQS
jgi:predicted exporter